MTESDTERLAREMAEFCRDYMDETEQTSDPSEIPAVLPELVKTLLVSSVAVASLPLKRGSW